MQHSPLILKNYFVTSLAIKANPQILANEQKIGDCTSISTRVEAAVNAENRNQWRVALQVMCPADENKSSPYQFDVELVGFFEVPEGLDQKLEKITVEDFVSVNAPAVLFGAAREVILLITGRGPFPPFLLPSMTFIDDMPSRKRLANQKAAASA